MRAQKVRNDHEEWGGVKGGGERATPEKSLIRRDCGPNLFIYQDIFTGRGRGGASDFPAGNLLWDSWTAGQLYLPSVQNVSERKGEMVIIREVTFHEKASKVPGEGGNVLLAFLKGRWPMDQRGAYECP